MNALAIISALLRRALFPISIGVIIISLLSHLLATFQSAPPTPTVLEQIVVQHQTLAATNSGSRDLLLIGDSSCLMNVAAEELARLHPDTTLLNCGMVSIVPLQTFAQVVAQHAAVYPGYPRYAVLIVHPEMLNAQTASDGERLTPYADSDSRTSIREKFLGLTQIENVFSRTLSPQTPQRLPGKYGEFYGFNSTFADYLQNHRGSALDPGAAKQAKFSPSDFALSPQFRRDLEAFRQLIPPHVRLFVSLSPIPQSTAVLRYSETYDQLQTELATALNCQILPNLPSTLPDLLFSTSTHLRPEYRLSYTRQLSASFRTALQLPIPPASHPF